MEATRRQRGGSAEANGSAMPRPVDPPSEAGSATPDHDDDSAPAECGRPLCWRSHTHRRMPALLNSVHREEQEAAHRIETARRGGRKRNISTMPTNRTTTGSGREVNKSDVYKINSVV